MIDNNTVEKKVYEDLSRYFDSSKEDNKPIYDFTDKYIVWIIGFSITGIFLFIKETEDLSVLLSLNIQKVVVALLSTSVIFGVIYRLSFYVSSSIGNIFHNDFIMRLSPSTMDNPREVNYDLYELEDMIELIKKDFNEDIKAKEVIFALESNDLDYKKVVKEDLVNHHKKSCSWYEDRIDSYMNYYKSTYLDIFGIDLDRQSFFTKATYRKSYYKLSIISATVSFYVCNLLFVAAIICMGISFIFSL